MPAHGDRHDSGHTVGQGCLFPRLGPGPHWVMAAFTACYYLDVLAKEAGMEAEPVGGDVEPTLEKEVPLEGTGTHWEDTGKNTAAARPTRRPQGLGLMLSCPQSPASGPVPSESPPQSQAPNSPFPQLPDSLFLRSLAAPPTRLLDTSSLFTLAPKGPGRFLTHPPSLDCHSLRQDSCPALCWREGLDCANTPHTQLRGLNRKQWSRISRVK